MARSEAPLQTRAEEVGATHLLPVVGNTANLIASRRQASVNRIPIRSQVALDRYGPILPKRPGHQKICSFTRLKSESDAFENWRLQSGTCDCEGRENKGCNVRLET